MPTTYNGIGTHYYGKRNRSTRAAVCQSCGRVGALESYDTRLWFVIIFIPILPLGRRRVIDACPSCRRHMAADAVKFEQARQLQISGGLERFRREGTPESALAAHAQLLGFHEHDQASELRAQALARFPDDARLRSALASHLRQVASYDEMARLDEEALALEPDLPEARAGVARWKMIHGEPDEARRLLDFLEEPGAGRHHDLGPLYTLAQIYQGTRRHEEALDLYAILLREAPDAGQQPEFRQLVRQSERALRRGESLLPRRRHSLRGLFLREGSSYSKNQRTLAAFAVALVLAAVGLVVSNESIRRHRVIRVVNACGAPVRIRVDDGPPQEVGETGQLSVSEGHHRLQVEGAAQETHDVDLGSGYFERWTHSPLWCLNPGGEAVLDQLTIYYAAEPRPVGQVLVVGRPFVSLPHVDYPFVEPPRQLRINKRKDQVLEKVAVNWIRGEDGAAFRATEPIDRARALDFAEKRLRRHPDVDLMEEYLRATFSTDRPRAEAFFKAGLDRQPPSIPWHRAYQALADHDGGQERMLAEYDARLAKEPTSGPLLYLRGRIDPDPNRSVAFFRRSKAADPRLPWPDVALGMHALNLGRWEEAVNDLRAAEGLGMNETQVTRAIHAARMAMGQAGALVGEYRAKMTGSPLDAATIIRLFDALAASGHPEAIGPERAAWDARLPGQARLLVGPTVRAISLYQAGHPEESAGIFDDGSSPVVPTVRVQSLAATGRASEAAADPSLSRVDDPWILAAVALGLTLEGRDDDASTWREKAAALLETRADDGRLAAALIRSATPPPLDQIDRGFLQPGEKALLLAILARRFPERGEEYKDAAARFNVLRIPPYPLVRRAIDGEAPGKP